MNKKISVLLMVTAISAAFCLSACGGDKNKETTKATPAATTAAATQKSEETQASSEAASSEKQDTASSDGIPKEGDTYKGKKVGSVEKVPDCDDDKHGVIYIYDENEELIEAKKY